MKKFLPLLLLMLIAFGTQAVLAQGDTVTKTGKVVALKTAKDAPASDSPKQASAAPGTAAMKAGLKDSTEKSCGCIPRKDAMPLGKGGWLLVFVPLLVFVLIGAISIKSLSSFNVREALSENVGAIITERNDLYTKENIEVLTESLGKNNNGASGATTAMNVNTLIPPTIEVTPLNNGQPIFRPSISRFIALISSWVIIAVVVSMSCLFIYQYMAYGCPPDFSSLTIILITLGIGILPYAVNKVANAAADKEKTI
jgi:hypothetical protein